MTGYIEPATPESAANFLSNRYGINPFFVLDRRVKDGGGSQRATFVDEGEHWTATLYYQSSNIRHSGSVLPTGSNWRLEEMREFRFSVRRDGDDDPVGEQGFSAHITRGGRE